jgi:hypothetical protein
VTLTPLVQLLDAAPETYRPAPDQRVWHVDGGSEVDRLVDRVVLAMIETGVPCFTLTEDELSPDELPAGSWQALKPGHWACAVAPTHTGVVEESFAYSGELHAVPKLRVD